MVSQRDIPDDIQRNAIKEGMFVLVRSLAEQSSTPGSHMIEGEKQSPKVVL